jgi:tetratricopeptide (TPR) repeat protein/ABC-type dipeptide/oligopeptide/nickel transport system ATPase component
MTEPNVGVTVSGGQLQGIVGAGSVVIENLTFYGRAAEEPVQSTGAEPIGPCPFPGLANFGPNDADHFFGRASAIARLAEAVGRQSFTALVGASGSGKSSVVLAGLAPRLQSDSGGNWRFSHFRIGTELESNPFLALARALAPLYVASDSDVERLRNTKLLATSLQAGELTLRDVFADCRSRNKGRRILLIADQFEEAFTLVKDDDVRTRFIDVLLAGFSDPVAGVVPDICLILTMRADFYGRALRHRPLADALQNNVENLGPMNRAELQVAIVRPAENAGVAFESGLVETLLDAVQSKPGGLPLLQFALREMWARQERKKITRKSYDDIGGVEGALAQRAETVFAALTRSGTDSAMEKKFQRLFTRLVTPGEGQEDTRRVVEREELGEEAWRLAQHLAGEENRLVVTNASSARLTAEVVHEALIRHWPRLVDWFNRDRAFQSWLRQLAPRKDEWRAHPQDEGTLLRGGPLGVAEDWLARRPDEVSDDERAFIDASIALRDAAKLREQQALAEKELAARARMAAARRLSVISLAAVLLLAGLTALAIRGFWLARQATQAAVENYRIAIEQATGSLELLENGYRQGHIRTKLMRSLVDRGQKTVASLPNERDEITVARTRLFDALSLANIAIGNVDDANKFVDAENVLADSLKGKDQASSLWSKLWAIARSRRAAKSFWQGDYAAAIDQSHAATDELIKISHENLEDEYFQQALIDAFEYLGDALRAQGNLEDANAAYQKCLSIEDGLIKAQPQNSRWLTAQAYTQQRIGDILLLQGDPAAASEHYKTYASLAAELAQIDPGNALTLEALAVSSERLGDVFFAMSKFEDALAKYQQKLEWADKLAAGEPTRVQWNFVLATAYQRIGEAHLGRRDYQSALIAFRKYQSLADAMLARNPSHYGAIYDVANAYEKVGDALYHQNDFKGAITNYQASLEKSQQLTDKSAGNPSWQKMLAMSYQRLGMALRSQGDLTNALAMFERCASISVNSRAWSPRTLWPSDVTKYCQQNIAELKPTMQ